MHHFRLPLSITGIALALVLVVGLALVTKIHREKIGDRAKIARVQQLGRGLGIATMVVVAPFWILAAARLGRERRGGKISRDWTM